MKLRVTTGTGLTMETESNDVKELFREVAAFQEIFGEKQCGKCDGTDLRCSTRKDKENNDYYSLVCNGCGASLDFGVTKVGQRLFPKRKLSNGDYDKEHQGWHHWNERQAASEQRPSTSSNEPEPF